MAGPQKRRPAAVGTGRCPLQWQNAIILSYSAIRRSSNFAC